MANEGRDQSLDTLLDLDGQVFVVDPAGKYWVKFEFKRVDPSPERPHGLKYSLTLHDETNQRLVGFDNAHPVPTRSGPSGRTRRQKDHKHRYRTVKPYEYTDAVALLTDFWAEVDKALKKKGVNS